MSDKKQMRPIVRGLKVPAQPKFVQQSMIMIRDPKAVAAFKTNVISFHSQHKVRISHYENGPSMFYVHLESRDSEYQQLSSRLQITELRNSRPFIGMACLVRHNTKIYRATIAKLFQNPAQDLIVNLVDFGYSVPVKLENIFHISEEFLSPFTFALPFSLYGINSGEIKVSDSFIGFYFRQLTIDRSLTLKCIPSDGPSNCQYCEIFSDNNENIIIKLRKWHPQDLRFRSQNKLESKTTFDVKVSYVESAREFYVHLQSPEILAEYDETCDELFEAMSRPPPSHQNPKKDTCCAVLVAGEWYRGLVIGMSNGKVQVKIIDYGIVEEIPEKHVHLLADKFVEKPPFAYRCCLKGFEGTEVSENISTQFDIFCGDGRGERKTFKMTIESFNDSYLVELEDFSVSPAVSVNKMLLKNSRPLIETIQLENARKRQKDERGNSSQRGRGNHSNKGVVRQQSPRTYIKKNDETQVGGTYFKTQKEKDTWGSKESTPSDQNRSSSDWEMPKNISRDQNSKVNWNDEKKKQQKKKPANDLKSGWVSTFLNCNRAYVHYDCHIEGLEKILDEMFAFYENKNSRPQLRDIRVGALCACRSNDGNWYRSHVEAIYGDKVKVFHREYGNSETLPKSKLRELNEKFAAIGDLVVPAYFAVKAVNENEEKSLYIELMKAFEEGSKEFNFKICSRFRDGWIIEPIDPANGNVIEELVKARKAIRVSDSELEKILEESEKFRDVKKEKKSPEKTKKITEVKQKENESKPKKEEKKSEEPEIPQKRKTPEKSQSQPSKNPSRISVKMTALTSPTDFYISRVEDASKFGKLHADIQIIATGAAPLKCFDESTLCLAQQPFDNHWYRAKILDSDEDANQIITVRCLDDGKTFSVDDKKLLKTMPAALEQKKSYGIACSLLLKIERRGEESATEFMMQLMEKDLQAEFVCEGDKNFIELFNGDFNVADNLVTNKFANRLEVLESGKGYTSHINSLSSFYVQFESDQLKLDVIAQYFEEVQGDFMKVEDCKPGDIVAALFPDDECWYRTKIEGAQGEQFNALFIDYGNVCTVNKIGKIGENAIIQLPRMSKHCSLAKPPGIKRFSAAAERKFEEICSGGATILDVKMKKPGDPTEVELFLNGKSVIDDLIPLCDPVDSILDKTLESNDSGMENLLSNE